MLSSVATVTLFARFFANNAYAKTQCAGVETSIIECGGGGDAGIWHILSLAINIMTIGVGILAIIGILWAGITYLTAGGSEDKVLMAKRRLSQIVIGLAAFAVVWAFSQWLLPGGILKPSEDNTGVNSFEITFDKTTTVGKTFSPKADFNSGATDLTYSLVSGDTDILSAFGNSAKCVSAGKTTLTAVSANGTKSTINIACEDPKDDGSSGSSSSSSGSSSSDNSTASDGSETVGSQKDVKYKGNLKMRSETEKVVKNHNKDFYATNYKTKIKQYGGYKKYLQKTLKNGDKDSVFSAYASKVNKNGNIKKIKVETAADLQAAAEYIWGLWKIWGPDYAAGGDPITWAGDDAFYQGYSERYGYHDGNDIAINAMLGPSENVRTNCNEAINTFYKSTTLTPIGGSSDPGVHTSYKPTVWQLTKKNHPKNGGMITRFEDLEVGDLMHFYSNSNLTGWHHVVMVGEIYKDCIIVYDGGSRFENLNGTSHPYKFKIPRKGSSLAGTAYGGDYWMAVRPWKIDQNVTLKGIN